MLLDPETSLGRHGGAKNNMDDGYWMPDTGHWMLDAGFWMWMQRITTGLREKS